MVIHSVIIAVLEKGRWSSKEAFFVAPGRKNVTQQVVRFKSERPTGVCIWKLEPPSRSFLRRRKPGLRVLTGSSWELDSQDR